MSEEESNVNLPAKKRGGQPLAKSFAKNKRKQNKLLSVLRDTFNMSAACRAAGVNPSTVYKYMETHPEFKELVDEARADACAEAEGEAYRRGIKGYDEPVYYRGQVVGSIKRHSDKMLELVLKGNMPEKYGNKSSIDVTMDADINVSSTKQKLLDMLNVSSLDEIEDAED